MGKTETTEVRMIQVTWVDSASHPYWQDGDEEYDLLHCSTVGYLIKETPTFLAIAQSIALDECTKPWADVIVIPQTAITAKRFIALSSRGVVK